MVLNGFEGFKTIVTDGHHLKLRVSVQKFLHETRR
jgi:hypothetical protein